MFKFTTTITLMALTAGCGAMTNISNGPQQAEFKMNDIAEMPFLASSTFADTTVATGEIEVARFGRLGYAAEVNAQGDQTFTAAPLNASGSLPALTAPSAGLATMNGTWGMARVINGEPQTQNGSMELQADFESATLVGGNDGLVFDASVENGVLGGTVTFEGEQGSLQGVIGADSAAGFFVSTSYAGAFAVAQN